MADAHALGADHRRAARARPAAGDRRLRHRPLVAGAAEPDAGDHAQDRPLVHRRPARATAASAVLVVDHHPARPQPRPASAGGGHRDRGAAHVPGRARLPAGPGLPVLQGRACRTDRGACTTPCATPPDYPSGMPIPSPMPRCSGCSRCAPASTSPRGWRCGSRSWAWRVAAYQYDMSFLRHDEIDETDVVVDQRRAADRGAAAGCAGARRGHDRDRRRAGRRARDRESQAAGADQPGAAPAGAARAAGRCRATACARCWSCR